MKYNKNIKRITQNLIFDNEGEIENVEYGKVPYGLVEGWEGITFFFKTKNSYNDKKHEAAVKPIIQQLKLQNEDYGVDWVIDKIEAVIWERNQQLTLVRFRVKDIY